MKLRRTKKTVPFLGHPVYYTRVLYLFITPKQHQHAIHRKHTNILINKSHKNTKIIKPIRLLVDLSMLTIFTFNFFIYASAFVCVYNKLTYFVDVYYQRMLS